MGFSRSSVMETRTFLQLAALNKSRVRRYEATRVTFSRRRARRVRRLGAHEQLCEMVPLLSVGRGKIPRGVRVRFAHNVSSVVGHRRCTCVGRMRYDSGVASR
jgi:hypothetical protein